MWPAFTPRHGQKQVRTDFLRESIFAFCRNECEKGP